MPSPDCNTAEVRNECFPFILMLSSFLKAIADTLPGGTKQWKIIGLLRQKWQILKITLPQKNGHRIKTPPSKLMILVSSCWKKNCIRKNGHKLVYSVPRFLKIIDRRCCAFFLGHPAVLHGVNLMYIRLAHIPCLNTCSRSHLHEITDSFCYQEKFGKILDLNLSHLKRSGRI